MKSKLQIAIDQLNHARANLVAVLGEPNPDDIEEGENVVLSLDVAIHHAEHALANDQK